jgi:sulfotransferase family protein
MVLLIGGQARSGTTLLGRLCNSHPEITLTNEFGYFYALGGNYIDHSRLLLKELWCKIREGNLWDSDMYAFVLNYLIKMRRYRKSLIDIAAIETTLRSIFPKASIVGDKAAGYVFELDRFVATSGVACSIIFRDCRDVTSSTLESVRTKWRKTHWTQTIDTAEKVAKSWVRSMEVMEHHKDRIHIIRYENLVGEPKRELEALAKWLKVDFSGFPETAIRSIRDTSIGKYKTGLKLEELKTVIEIAGPTMARLGYY